MPPLDSTTKGLRPFRNPFFRSQTKGHQPGSRRITDAPRRMACTKGTALLRRGDARRRATGYPKRGLLSQSLRYAPAWKLVGQPPSGYYSMAGKGVRGRNETGLILRPRALFGTFSRERKYALQAAPSQALIHILNNQHPVNSVDKPPKTPTFFPMKAGIISLFMEYNHEGENFSTPVLENIPPSPQSINPKK